MLAVPVELLASAILVVNNVRDLAIDRRAGKRTLAVRLGRTRARGSCVCSSRHKRCRDFDASMVSAAPIRTQCCVVSCLALGSRVVCGAGRSGP